MKVFEISNDAKMKRTMQRPLPSGRMTAPHAVAWASLVGVGGTAILAYKVMKSIFLCPTYFLSEILI